MVGIRKVQMSKHMPIDCCSCTINATFVFVDDPIEYRMAVTTGTADVATMFHDGDGSNCCKQCSHHDSMLKCF
jgi:hypothetical protein